MISKQQSKFIKSLKIKKYRDAENAFLIEGKKNVTELLSSDYNIISVICSKSFHETYGMMLRGDFDVIVAKTNELAKIGTFKVNNECVAVAQKKEWDLKDLDLKGVNFFLDNISDPGNLGTIIRTLDWFGFEQLICSPNTADFYNPKVINASMGSFTRMKVYYADLTDLTRKQQIPVFGADMNGIDLKEMKFPDKALIVMGNESKGLSPELKPLISQNISIKGFGKAESLNVGIATGIICHQIRNY